MTLPPRSLRSRILPAILYRLARVGICIEPFLVVREGASSSVASPPADPGLSCGFIGSDDIPELVRFCPDGATAATLAEWLGRGLLCYAVKEGNRVVARMWCDLAEFNHPPNFRRLGSHEAYLFAARTDPAFRGRSLAPFMRLNCYAALRALGRDTFYSYTEYFNASARRFKKKIGAVDEALRVHVTLFGRFSRTFTLRRYATPG